MSYLVLSSTAVAVILVIGGYRYFRTYLKFRGQRIVSCPTTYSAAAVRVAAGRAALKSAAGHDSLRLCECSRWDGPPRCDQHCLEQIKEAPEACLVWNIMSRWYEGRTCAYCHRPFKNIHWHDHPPAMVDSERKTIQWNEVAADRLQETMRTHVPVCWNCHIAETFRRVHPELVVDRPVH
ncbi:MAG TPA: hypothetical protein VE077_20385 [Candidatus Methylomirabilis sp.]|nr:hypothetical protein [Candidatus Methylomirabilis sp.]